MALNELRHFGCSPGCPSRHAMSPYDALPQLGVRPYDWVPWVKPMQILQELGKNAGEVSLTDDHFKANMKVKGFTPAELKVTMRKGFVEVEGIHEEKSEDKDGGGSHYEYKRFHRRFILPEGVEALECSLTQDGQLSLTAPIQKNKVKDQNIPIKMA